MVAPAQPEILRLPAAQRQWRLAAAVSAPVALVLAPSLLRLDVPLCLFRAASGLPCPLCGGTHAGAALAHGDLLAAWQANPGVTLGLGLALTHGLVLCAEAASGRSLGGTATFWRQAWLGVAAVLLLSWVLRLAGGP